MAWRLAIARGIHLYAHPHPAQVQRWLTREAEEGTVPKEQMPVDPKQAASRTKQKLVSTPVRF